MTSSPPPPHSLHFLGLNPDHVNFWANLYFGHHLLCKSCSIFHSQVRPRPPTCVTLAHSSRVTQGSSLPGCSSHSGAGEVSALCPSTGCVFASVNALNTLQCRQEILAPSRCGRHYSVFNRMNALICLSFFGLFSFLVFVPWGL